MSAGGAGRCERTVAHPPSRHDRLAHRVEVRCRGVDPEVPARADGARLRAPRPRCAPPSARITVTRPCSGRCLAGFDRCRGERLFAAVFPRSGELLRVAGVSASTRAALACLPRSRRRRPRRARRRHRRGRHALCAEHRAGRGASRGPDARERVEVHTDGVGVPRGRMVTRLSTGRSVVTAATETCGGAFRRIDDARRAFGRAVGRRVRRGTHRLRRARGAEGAESRGARRRLCRAAGRHRRRGRRGRG